MAKVSEYKKKLVEDMAKLMREYNIIGIVNMENLPAPQLQSVRSELRGKIDLFMTKKRLMKLALDKIKNEKNHIEELEKYFEGMPALVFTNENPFKLSKLLQKSKTKAPAKPGQTAPDDIVVNKGPTPFAPGPIISELSSAGLKVGVEAGKVAVKEDTVVAKKGEKIKPKVAEILARLDIKPMEVGLGLVAAYENGIIYQKDILEIDEKAFNEKINLAATQAFNLAFDITYTTKDNISLLIGKAFNDAKSLGISQEILDKGIIEDLLNKAETEMLGLKYSANIETKASEVKEEKAEEKKEEKKPVEVKEKKPAKEIPKEEPRPEEKKIEALAQEEAVKKEEKVLEEEKKIIEEEKKLEEEKPKEIPVEREVQEAVKKEEEKKLEKERIEKEKELEKIETQKEEIKKAEPKPEDETDKKVRIIVEKTKKFIEGKEETAADIIKEIKKEEQQEKKEKKEEPKEKEKRTKVLSAHDLKKKKEEEAKKGKETEQEKKHKEVEELTKELLKKGTLRKK